MLCLGDGTRRDGVLADVSVRVRLAAWLDISGVSTILLLTDVILSAVSVASYIIGTYGIGYPVDWYVDLVCAAYFAAYFLLCLWLSDERYTFLASWSTLVDVLTITPVFVLSFVSLSNVTTDAQAAAGIYFLRALRLVRILRLLQVGSRMASKDNTDVLEAGLQLVLSVLCMLVLGAGAFFELERIQPKNSGIKFHESIYWAAVTLTTVGYGDLAPSWALTQMLVIVFLCMTFTVLPLLTGKLLDALNASTRWQRTRHHNYHSSRNQHLVFTGYITADVAWQLADEVFHEDKGFAGHKCVLLVDKPPSPGIRALMSKHHSCRLIKYLQGTPLLTYDLERALVEYSAAVFILADKQAPDPKAADLATIMTALAVGEYLQQRRLALETTFKWRGQRLLHLLLFKPARVPETLPRVIVQLLLPESVQQLERTIYSLGYPLSSTGASTAASKQQQESLMHRLSFAGAGGGLLHRPRTWETFNASIGSPLLSAPLKAINEATSVVGKAGEAMVGAVRHVLELPAGDGTSRLAGSTFWRAYGACCQPVCVTEIKQALLSASCLGAPGAISLVTNLVVTRDVSITPQEKLQQRKAGVLDGEASWLPAYLHGVSQELYLLVAFPPALHGLTFREAARFIYDCCQQAVLLAVEVAGEVEPQVTPLDLVLRPGMSGHLICEDLLLLGDISDTTAEEVQQWRALNNPAAAAARGFVPAPVCLPSEQYMHPAASMLDPESNSSTKDPENAKGMRSDLRHPADGGRGTAWEHQEQEQQQQLQVVTDPGADSSEAAASTVSSGFRGLFQTQSSKERHEQPARLQRRSRSKGGVVIVQSQSSAKTTCLTTDSSGHSCHGKAAARVSAPGPPAPVPRTYNPSMLGQHNSYHLLPPGEAPSSPQEMLLQQVTFSGHLLVLSSGPVSMHHLAALVAPFRCQMLPHQLPIVIVVSELPSLHSGWSYLAGLPKVHLLLVGPTSEDTLLRANAGGAAKVLLLAGSGPQLEDRGNEALVQATLRDALLMDLYHLIRLENPSVMLAAELLAPSSLAYFTPLDPLLLGGRGDAYYMSASYMAGQVLLPAVADYMMLQSYTNPGATSVLLQLLQGWCGVAVADTSEPHPAAQHLAPRHCGRLSSSSDRSSPSNDSSPDQTGKAAATAAAAEVAHTSTQQQHHHTSSSSPAVAVPTLVQLHVQPEQAGLQYTVLFHQMLIQQGVLLLGLYRPVHHQQATSYCVLTNPAQHTVVWADDRLFAVAPIRAAAGGSGWPEGMVW